MRTVVGNHHPCLKFYNSVKPGSSFFHCTGGKKPGRLGL